MKKAHFLDRVFGENNHVLLLSMVVISLMIIFIGSMFPAQFTATATSLTALIIENTGWWLSLCNVIFLLFVSIIAFTKYGDIKLGGKDDTPEYSFFDWFCILFSCGLGVALYYSCVSEPITHYMKPPYIALPQTAASASLGLQIGIFHIGISTWANFAAIGLVIAYFTYTKGMPFSIVSPLEVLFGRKIHPYFVTILDGFTVFATLGGVATSIGMGVFQLKYGISWLTGSEVSNMTIAAIFVCMLVVYTTTAVSGIDHGIKHLSTINMCLAFFLLAYLFIFGPTIFQLDMMVQTTGELLKNLPQIISFTDAARVTDGWTGSWTIFYYCWTASWAPFVGGFVAKISRGRTIKEFIFGVMGAPVILTIVWYGVFGGSALYAQMNGVANIVGAMSVDLSAGIYTLFETLPFSKFIGFIVIINVTTFLATSANTAAFFNAVIVAKGKEPRNSMVILWSLIMGLVGMVLMFSGGLKAVQSGAMATGLIFSVIMILMIISMIRSLRKDANLENASLNEACK